MVTKKKPQPVTRKFSAVPGFDCRHKCEHSIKGDHGIHGDEWHYAVIAPDGRTALSLTVFTNRFPATVDPKPVGCLPTGADLSLHVARKKGGACEFVKGGRCQIKATSGLAAYKFFEDYGCNRPEQTKRFWKALEVKFEEWEAGRRNG